MKKKEIKDKVIDNLYYEKVVDKFDVDKDFVKKICALIEEEYKFVILSNYGINALNDDPLLVYNINLSICLNMIFDSDRFEKIEYSNEYITNFAERIVSQTIYSDLDYNLLHTSPILNHPIIKSVFALSSLIKYRVVYDNSSIKKRLRTDFTPVAILIKEAMESLEGTYLLISNKSYSQAMTVYRLYLEQIINVIALMKNPNLISKYVEFQNLATKYALNIEDSDVLKVLEDNHIPPRDIKSYLNYGWIENMEGFEEMGKRRFSIKMMAKLCQLDDIYELYSDSTNYVHMNFLLANIDWVKEINKVMETTFATILGIIKNYHNFTGYDFVYKNINMPNELITILNEFITITSKMGDSYDVLRLKSA